LMKRGTHRLLIFVSQASTVGGLGLAAVWNLAYLIFDLSPDPGWWGLLAPLPGLILWGVAPALPGLTSASIPAPDTVFRLVYSAPDGWRDEQARTALLNLATRAGWLDIAWVRDTQGSACLLAAPAGYEAVLHRLVGAVFPGGQLEADDAPLPRDGVTILRLKRDAAFPAPDQLCMKTGVEGVYYRWQSAETAILSLWGDERVMDVALEYAKKGDLLPGKGSELLKPRFGGGNPWPGLPVFPPSGGNPGLNAVSGFERLEPGLRLNGSGGLVLGRDAGGGRIGSLFPIWRVRGAPACWG